MNPTVTAALIAAGAAFVTAVVALFAAFTSAWSSRKNAESTNANQRAIEELRTANEKSKAAEQRGREMSKFSEPLARAAYDLQSRLFNILRQQLGETLLVKGSAREQAYFIDNTTFVIAQFLCWTELVRREIQFIDLGENVRTRELSNLRDEIYNVWGSDKHSALFRLFAGEQRAIGEALIVAGPRGPECMGYGAFLKTFRSGSTDALIEAIRADVTTVGTQLAYAADRLTRLQHALINLLDMLDPNCLRFRSSWRTKV